MLYVVPPLLPLEIGTILDLHHWPLVNRTQMQTAASLIVATNQWRTYFSATLHTTKACI